MSSDNVDEEGDASVADFLRDFMTNPYGVAFMQASTEAKMLHHMNAIQKPPDMPQVTRLRQRRKSIQPAQDGRNDQEDWVAMLQALQEEEEDIQEQPEEEEEEDWEDEGDGDDDHDRGDDSSGTGNAFAGSEYTSYSDMRPKGTGPMLPTKGRKSAAARGRQRPCVSAPVREFRDDEPSDTSNDRPRTVDAALLSPPMTAPGSEFGAPDHGNDGAAEDGGDNDRTHGQSRSSLLDSRSASPPPQQQEKRWQERQREREDERDRQLERDSPLSPRQQRDTRRGGTTPEDIRQRRRRMRQRQREQIPGQERGAAHGLLGTVAEVADDMGTLHGAGRQQRFRIVSEEVQSQQQGNGAEEAMEEQPADRVIGQCAALQLSGEASKVSEEDEVSNADSDSVWSIERRSDGHGDSDNENSGGGGGGSGFEARLDLRAVDVVRADASGWGAAPVDAMATGEVGEGETVTRRGGQQQKQQHQFRRTLRRGNHVDGSIEEEGDGGDARQDAARADTDRKSSVTLPPLAAPGGASSSLYRHTQQQRQEQSQQTRAPKQPPHHSQDTRTDTDSRRAHSAQSVRTIASVSSSSTTLPPLRSTGTAAGAGLGRSHSTRQLSSRAEMRQQQRRGLQLSFKSTQWAVGTKQHLQQQMQKQARALRRTDNAAWVSTIHRRLHQELNDVERELTALRQQLDASGLPSPQAQEHIRVTLQRQWPIPHLRAFHAVIERLPGPVQKELEAVADIYSSILDAPEAVQPPGCTDDNGNALNAYSSLDQLLDASQVRQQLSFVHGVGDFDADIAALGEFVQTLVTSCRQRELDPRRIVRYLEDVQTQLREETAAVRREIAKEEEHIAQFRHDIEEADATLALMQQEIRNAHAAPKADVTSDSPRELEAMHREIILNTQKQVKLRRVRERGCVPRRVIDWIEDSIENAKSDTIWWKKQAELLRLDVADLNARVKRTQKQHARSASSRSRSPSAGNGAAHDSRKPAASLAPPGSPSPAS